MVKRLRPFAQVLGWTLITVAGYSRVPQMINIYDARSAKGLSMASLEVSRCSAPPASLETQQALANHLPCSDGS